MIKAELKRCIRIERRWNRNEVSRGSPDKEVNRRPTSLKKFTADALRGPRVSIAKFRNGGNGRTLDIEGVAKSGCKIWTFGDCELESCPYSCPRDGGRALASFSKHRANLVGES